MKLNLLDLKIYIADQRRLYHAGLLHPWRIARFEAIPGWKWGKSPKSKRVA